MPETKRNDAGMLNGSYSYNGQPQRGPDPDQLDAFREWIRPFLENTGPIVPSKEPPVGWVKYPDAYDSWGNVGKCPDRNHLHVRL